MSGSIHHWLYVRMPYNCNHKHVEESLVTCLVALESRYKLGSSWFMLKDIIATLDILDTLISSSGLVSLASWILVEWVSPFYVGILWRSGPTRHKCCNSLSSYPWSFWHVHVIGIWHGTSIWGWHVFRFWIINILSIKVFPSSGHWQNLMLAMVFFSMSFFKSKFVAQTFEVWELVLTHYTLDKRVVVFCQCPKDTLHDMVVWYRICNTR